MAQDVRKFFFILLLLPFFLTTTRASHQYCVNAKVVCSITEKPSELQLCNSACSGDMAFVNAGNSCFSGGLTRWAFYMFTVKQSGKLTMSIIPKAGFPVTDDYNWAIFDVSNGCNNPGNAIRCSASNTNGDSTGLNFSATDFSEGLGGDGWCQYLDVFCGHTYLIVLDNPGNGSSGFDMSFGGSCLFGIPENDSLPGTVTICAGQPTDFSIDTTSCYTNNPFLEYYWDFGSSATPQIDTGVSPSPVTFSGSGSQNIFLTSEFSTGGGSCIYNVSQAVNVSSIPPVSTFTVSAPACLGMPVIVIYTGTAAPGATYAWDFDGASIISGSGQGPYSVQWLNGGPKAVTLMVSDCSANSITTTYNITVADTPTSAFTVASPVCINENAQIAYIGTGGAGETYDWDFSGGNILSGSGMGPYEVNWSSSGTKNITLIVTGSAGCSSSINSLDVTVEPAPIANAGSDVSVCSGNPVLIGTSATSGYTYKWSPPAGISDITVADPELTVFNPGNSAIILNYYVATSSGSCISNDSVQVTVLPVPTAILNAPGSVCVNESLVISYAGNADTASASFFWDFDEATMLSSSGQSYVVSWDTSGQKLITLSVLQNGCTSYQQQYIITVYPPNSNAGPDQVFCSGENISIGIPASNGYSYSWSPGTGLSDSTEANPVLNIINNSISPVFSEYIVTTSYLGCSVKDTVQVNVNPNPLSDAGPDVNPLCSGSPALIGSLGNPDFSYSWFPSIGLSSSSVSSPTVTLLNSNAAPLVEQFVVTTINSLNGCKSTDTVNITVYQIPTSYFSAPDSVCAKMDAEIIYTGNASLYASYQWIFNNGDSFPGTGPGPHYVSWDYSGSYIINLSVTEICSTAFPVSIPIYVKPAPLADAGPDTAFCSGDSLMIGASTIPDYFYLWSPATGLSDSTISNPVVTNTNFNPTPLVTDYFFSATLNNCTSFDTVQVAVYQVPTSDFSVPSQVCGSDPLIFTYSGNAGASGIYSWDFDGGEIVAGGGQGPVTVNWPTTGEKNVSLTVSENGCSSAISFDSLNVYSDPVAVAGINGAFCVGNSFVLGTSPTPGYSYAWSPSYALNDSTLSNPVVYLVSSGNYIDTITYTVITSANNCVSADSTVIIIYPNPIASFSISDTSQCLTGNSFDFQSSGTNLPAAGFLWNFGFANPPSSYTSSQDDVVFPASGTFPVSLMVAQYGCTNTVTQYVNVFPMPTASFGVSSSSGCEPLQVDFYSSANLPVSYIWNFGDFPGSNLQSPEHTFQEKGSYYVSVEIYTSNSCSAFYFVDTIMVFPKPEAWFSFGPEQITNLVPEVNFSDGSNINILAWNWDFGDGTTSKDKSPSHLYPDSGTYFVSLSVENEFQCLDTAWDTVIVYPNFTFFAPNAFTPNNDGQNDYFIPKAVGIDVTNYEFHIYDRGGKIIFGTQSPDKPWDGKHGGSPVVSGVYIWVVSLRDVFKNAHRYTGHVAVLK